MEHSGPIDRESDADAGSASRDRLLDRISAVAAGDATRGDIAAELRNEGIDALELMVEVLAAATRKGRTARSYSRPVNPHGPGADARHDPSQTVHQVPTLPFMLNGTLYDPPDIARFNGRDLHFSLAPGADHLNVVDDADVMRGLWSASWVSANVKVLGSQTGESVGGSSVEPTNFGGGIGGGASTGGPVVIVGTPAMNFTVFYEDTNFEGSQIELEENRGYWDLTEVPWTIFGTGDWNDTISSVEMRRTQVTVLHEHVQMTGSSATLFASARDLFSAGFNDRASSVETW